MHNFNHNSVIISGVGYLFNYWRLQDQIIACYNGKKLDENGDPLVVKLADSGARRPKHSTSSSGQSSSDQVLCLSFCFYSSFRLTSSLIGLPSRAIVTHIQHPAPMINFLSHPFSQTGVCFILQSTTKSCSISFQASRYTIRLVKTWQICRWPFHTQSINLQLVRYPLALNHRLPLLQTSQ